MVSILSDDPKKSTLKIVAGIVITSLIGIAIAFFQGYLFDPHLSLDYTSSVRTGCYNVSEAVTHEKCSDGNNFTKIYVEKLTLTNWGPRQAKNVDVRILSSAPISLVDYDCLEGNVTKFGPVVSFTLDFKRLSTKLDCQLKFENIQGTNIQSITAISDDIPAYTWHPSDLIESQFLYYVVLAYALIIVSMALLVFVSYKTIRQVQYAILEKKLRFPEKVKSYSCHMMFQVPLDNETVQGIQDASNKAAAMRDAWLDKISALTKVPIQEINDNIHGLEKVLKIKNNEIRIAMQEITTQQQNKKYRSARVRVRSENYGVIVKILMEGKQPCWAFKRHLYTEFDVASAVKTIRDRIDRDPISTSYSGVGKTQILTNVDYTVLMAEGYQLRILLYKGDQDSGGSIEIVCESGEPNVGFYQIRKFFPLRTVLLILYGEIESSKILDLVKKACSNPKL